MFPLCRTCTVNENQKPCKCSNKDRVLIHTWCTPEINLAINMGYIIIEIYEVFNWSENTSNEQRLFSNYINMFLQMKTQASGYPSNVKTCEQKNEYIRKYEKQEGVHLDPNKIEHNPGLRSIGKLALNSFYGKFGQRTDMKKVQFINQYEKLYSILMDVTKVIKKIHVLNSDMIMMEYKQSEEFEEPSNKTNVIISAFCSAYAHIKLFKMMNRLGKCVMYHNTDSIIYTYKSGQWIPPTGEYLGDLTDELSCNKIGCKGCKDGHWIEDFVSCRAKNYAYKLNTGEVVCKVHGFSPNYSASQIVNLESMKDALISWKNKIEQPEMVTIKTMILRDKLKANVYTFEMPKNCGVIYNKCIVMDDYTTLPYGF